ncbi:MAG: hypothetical protein GIS02_03520 [Methanosarcinales archaeon]|uniref:Uncharacterized protein n=1 Tax=Candidatus Ethanoperedens thermophilum TaxID=2766897 RepID=A0A848DAM0_9EURY|nr:hypothetical protein [Candidatus Ethanoperedens thermophilum]
MIDDEMENRLEDIARHLNISKKEVIETALFIFESIFKEKKQKDAEFEMANEIMEKASADVRSSNIRLAQRAKIIEEAKVDIFEVISNRWGMEI